MTFDVPARDGSGQPGASRIAAALANGARERYVRRRTVNTSIPATRMFVILARRARKAVIFRRGPSRQVALILWHTDRDTFEVGQWFKGRIYERRCDLSPSGDRLIYFAASWKRHHAPGSWTAISKPPWLTAVTLWPKGDAWGGGGLFENEKTILLNHRQGDRKHPGEFAIGEGSFPPPRDVIVKPLWERAGWGEDDPIYTMRAMRDGWTILQEGNARDPSQKSTTSWTFDPPTISAKTSPRDAHLELRSTVRGMHERNGAWYVIDHSLRDARSDTTRDFGRSEWADWDQNGDILLARGGKLFRGKRSRSLGDGALVEIADFSTLRFEEKTSPPAARRWR